MTSARSISMPPDASAPVLTVNRPTRIGPSAARTLKVAALETPNPATLATNLRREICISFSPGSSLVDEARFNRAFGFHGHIPARSILARWNNRQQNVALALAVNMQRGRSGKKAPWPIARVVVQERSASQ